MAVDEGGWRSEGEGNNDNDTDKIQLGKLEPSPAPEVTSTRRKSNPSKSFVGMRSKRSLVSKSEKQLNTEEPNTGVPDQRNLLETSRRSEQMDFLVSEPAVSDHTESQSLEPAEPPVSTSTFGIQPEEKYQPLPIPQDSGHHSAAESGLELVENGTLSKQSGSAVRGEQPRPSSLQRRRVKSQSSGAVVAQLAYKNGVPRSPQAADVAAGVANPSEMGGTSFKGLKLLIPDLIDFSDDEVLGD
jgi:hypothetical protein